MMHIGKSFSGVKVLDDVGFDLEPGEIHVLAGENGAGKSTLIKILSGVHSDYEGRIMLHGRPVRFSSPHEAVRHGISVIHQEMSLVPSMSVMDNLYLGGAEMRSRWWISRREIAAKARALLEQMDLDMDPALAVEEYPLASQQMIEIARALARDVRIIVMDEPTSALSEPEVDRLFRQIAELKKKGCGIIYISHRLEEIYRVADRISVLRDGRHVGTSPASDLSRDELVRWMVGREIKQQFPDRRTRPGSACLEVASLSVPHPVLRKQWAVRDVSFAVRKGEILGIAGLQGSGASEMLMGLFGAYGNTLQGQVRLDGVPFPAASPSRAIRSRVALVTNDRKGTGLILRASITPNITLASLPRFSPGGWLRPAREREAGRRYRSSLSIRCSSLEQEVGSLSGGNQQKVVLAKWLEAQPVLLLLDEPTRGVDVGAKHEIYELMNQWTEQGMGILLITSEMPELLAMSDRIIVLHCGRLAAEFSREEATQERILRAAMGEGISV